MSSVGRCSSSSSASSESESESESAYNSAASSSLSPPSSPRSPRAAEPPPAPVALSFSGQGFPLDRELRAARASPAGGAMLQALEEALEEALDNTPTALLPAVTRGSPAVSLPAVFAVQARALGGGGGRVRARLPAPRRAESGATRPPRPPCADGRAGGAAAEP